MEDLLFVVLSGLMRVGDAVEEGFEIGVVIVMGK